MLALPLIVRGGHAFLRIVQDFNRLDEVFRLIDTLNDAPHFKEHFVESYRQLPAGPEVLKARPRLGPIDLEALGQLPVGTLGREYADFMRRHGLDPAALPTRPVQDEASFIEAHLRETHDVWHVVTGFGPDVVGELGLQAFYMAQAHHNRVSLALVTAGLVNTFLYSLESHAPRMTAIAQGWLLGRKARSLFGVDWKQLWSTPLAEVRASLGVEVEAMQALVAADARQLRERMAQA